MGGGGTICLRCGTMVPDNRTHLPCRSCRGTNFSTHASGSGIRDTQRMIKSRAKRDTEKRRDRKD